MKRTTYRCGLEAAFDVIGGKWKVVILCRLFDAPRRFGELRRLVEGVTEKMLTQQLREMEADGLVLREAFPEVPPRVLYSLTPAGRELRDSMADLCSWGGRHLERTGRAVTPPPA